MELWEFMGVMFVKIVVICYLLCVVCFDVDCEKNFFGLVIDCFGVNWFECL